MIPDPPEPDDELGYTKKAIDNWLTDHAMRTDFNDFFGGKTVGVRNFEPVYYSWDVDYWMRSRSNKWD